MCGIVGFNAEKPADKILINSLKKLEYRGYDSSGIALAENGKISVLKSEGKLKNLIEKSEKTPFLSGVGIGHTRWATHGEPTETNAHPHSSHDGKFSVVHNGIIENHTLIKNELKRKGFHFYSQTDTEVIPQLLSYHYTGDVLEALRKTVLTLDGSFAICVLCADFPDTIFAAKKQSPLIVGKGKKESAVSSDISAFDESIDEYVTLDDCEIAEIKKDKINFYDFNLNPTEKAFKKIDFLRENISKGDYEHFMLKEIFEQPEKIENLLKSHTKNNEFVFEKLSDFSHVQKIYIVACGSAFHAGLAGKTAIEKLARIPTEVEIASEFRYKNPILNDRTLVILISQSGETADTIAAMRLSKICGAETVAIVNNPMSTIANESDFVLNTNAGIEVAVATTKGYTTQVAMLYMLALHASKIKGTLNEKEIEFYTQEILKIPQKISHILKGANLIKEKAEKYFDRNDVFFIGRNTDYSAACEGSLKFKEISYINSSAFAAGELKHGTIALVEKGTFVFAVNANKQLYKKTLSNIEEVFSRGADVLMLTTNQGKSQKYDCIVIPDCPDIFLTLLEVIPLQLFAYYVADKKNLSIDMPKNLAKSVTVE